MNLITKFHKSKVVGKLFHTLGYCLQEELKGCYSVLDIGCGPNSPLQYCEDVKYSVGVEVFKPYFEESMKKKIHNKYFKKKIEVLDFKENEFDAVIMIEVLEHLDEKVGRHVLTNAERWAKRKVIVSSPNGFIEQKAVDNNLYQRHLSGWSLEKMRDLGYECRGLAGLKLLRKPVENETMGNDLTTSIRFEPKLFWFGLAVVSQLLTYFYPKLAFELFSVKREL